nr:RNA-directed DNA polymerase, eukaryota, reverse transcriptase zinc-binding domain protein [Tanacetum cinerariifolium]
MVRYARVLIEVNAKKELADNIEIVYKNKEGSVHCRKNVKMLWKKEKAPEKTLSVKRGNSSNNDKENKDKAKKKWFVHKHILEAMKRTSNKFTVFEMYDELLVDKGEGNEEEDVLEELNDIAKNMKGNDVKGMDDGVLDLKSKKVDKVCEKVYGRWNWITNMRYCNKGCRIMIGWNEDQVSISVIHMAKQSVLLKMETRNNIKLYGTFIYPANGGIERKELWRDLEIYKRIVGKDAWFFSLLDRI